MSHSHRAIRARYLVAIVGALLCTPVTISSALAQSNDTVDAEHLFREGKRLMKEKQFAEACDAFQTSMKLDGTLSTLLNLADCREKNGQLATAWGLFIDAEQRARGDTTQGSLAKTAKDRAEALEPRLSYLTVSVADESRIEGLVILRDGAVLDEGLWNRAAPVDGGDHVIAGRAPGHEEWLTKVNVPIEGGRISVDVPKFKEIKELIVRPIGVDNDRPGMFTTRRKIAVGVGGAGVVLLGVGALLGVQARGLEDDAYALCPTDPCSNAIAANDLVDRAETRVLLANVSFGVGAAAVAASVVLWFLGAPEKPAAGMSAQVSPGFNGVVLAGRF